MTAIKKSNSRSHYCFAAPLLAFYGENLPGDIYSQILRWTGNMDRQSWFLVFCAVLICGGILLRGFGSRSNY